MIEIKINFKHFKLEMVIGNSKPWFTKEEKVIERNEENAPIDVPYQDNPYEVKTQITHITKLAEKYQTELNNNAFPPNKPTPPIKAMDENINENRSDVSSLMSDPIFLPNEGREGMLYGIGDMNDDEMGKLFKDLPDVEVIDDEYERRMVESVKLMNQRYATFKETHDI